MTFVLQLRDSLPVLVGAWLALSACSNDVSKPVVAQLPDAGVVLDQDPEFELYPQSKLLEVEITLADADWQQLKGEGRNINDVFSGCSTEAFEYTKFPAKVRVGQHTYDKVSVRKKGYLGSISMYRPSLRVDLDEFLADQRLGGSKALTLNNSQSDRSYAAQCVAYEQFSAAGIPAPRCGFASVKVNGESIGVYVSVEPVKKPFLRDHFGGDRGDLYEGGGNCDFRDDLLKNFEKKTNESEPTSPQLQAVADALKLPDEQLLAALAPLLDVDEFLRFWAVESLVGHWDGYSGDLNNFFVYVDPEKGGKLRFIPWGTDNAFEDQHPFLPAMDWPRSALAWARLPRRLYAIEDTRKRYQAILREELGKHWDEVALNSKIDAIASLTADSVNAGAVQVLHSFINARRALLTSELDAAAKPWTIEERAPSVCRPDSQSKISATFSTTWGDLAATTAVTGNTVTATVQGSALAPVYVVAAAGLSMDPAAPGKALRLTVGNPDGSFTLFQFQLNAPSLAPGELKLHGFEVFGVVLNGRTKEDGTVSIATVGYIGKGSITFEAADITTGAPIKGHLEADIVSAPPATPTTMMPVMTMP